MTARGVVILNAVKDLASGGVVVLKRAALKDLASTVEPRLQASSFAKAAQDDGGARLKKYGLARFEAQRIMQSMRFYNFEIVIEKEPEDEGYLAYCPALPGCFSDGLSIEEARINIREALQQHLIVLLDQGEEIPQRDSIVHVEELSVGIPS